MFWLSPCEKESFNLPWSGYLLPWSQPGPGSGFQRGGRMDPEDVALGTLRHFSAALLPGDGFPAGAKGTGAERGLLCHRGPVDLEVDCFSSIRQYYVERDEEDEEGLRRYGIPEITGDLPQ